MRRLPWWFAGPCWLAGLVVLVPVLVVMGLVKLACAVCRWYARR